MRNHKSCAQIDELRKSHCGDSLKDVFHNFVDICRCIFNYVSSLKCSVIKIETLYYSNRKQQLLKLTILSFLLMQSSVKYIFFMKIISKETVYKLIITL